MFCRRRQTSNVNKQMSSKHSSIRSLASDCKKYFLCKNSIHDDSAVLNIEIVLFNHVLVPNDKFVYCHIVTVAFANIETSIKKLCTRIDAISLSRDRPKCVATQNASIILCSFDVRCRCIVQNIVFLSVAIAITAYDYGCIGRWFASRWP